MTIAAVREKLHNLIDHADGKRVKAMLTLLEKDAEQDYELSDAEMKELDSRWDDHLSGKTKSYTLEESKKNINKYIEKKRKNNGV